MDEIEVRATRCVEVEVPIGGRRGRPIDGCVPAIARFCDCKVWLARAEVAPLGNEPDGFDWTRPGSRFAVIDRAIRTEDDTFKRVNPRLRAARLRRASASFQHGLVPRVAAQLTAMHEAREAAVHAQRSTGTALILAKHRVVEEAFTDTDVRLVSMSAIGQRRVVAAFREGWAAGERVNLNRPVPGSAAGLLT